MLASSVKYLFVLLHMIGLDFRVLEFSVGLTWKISNSDLTNLLKDS